MNDNYPPRATRAQKRMMIVLFFASIAIGAGLATCAKADELSGPARARDGDDIILTSAEHGDQRIRLHGIDAFEVKQMCRRNGASWACGVEAKAVLHQLVEGKTVVCDGRSRRMTSVWRLKRRCTADGFDIGEQLVLRGLAVSRLPRYEAAQAVAQKEKAGMWAGCFYDPSLWRKYLRGELGSEC